MSRKLVRRTVEEEWLEDPGESCPPDVEEPVEDGPSPEDEDEGEPAAEDQ